MSRLQCQLCALPLGYKVREGIHRTKHDSAEQRNLVLRFGLATLFSLGIVALSLAIYVGSFEQVFGSVRHYMPFVLMALATPVVLYCGHPIHRKAWLGLRNFTLRMETLLSLGVLSAYIFSVVQAFRGAPHVHFDSASAIVTFALAAELIEGSAKAKTFRWVTLLYQMVPKKVRLFADGCERFVSVDDLNPGHVFLVEAGEQFPADGMVETGNSHADESLLTGETAPVSKQAGDSAIGGSTNLDGVLHVKATHTGAESTLARIIALVERSLGKRSPLEGAVKRVSHIFVPSAIAIALVTFGVCWIGGFATFDAALKRLLCWSLPVPARWGWQRLWR